MYKHSSKKERKKKKNINTKEKNKIYHNKWEKKETLRVSSWNNRKYNTAAVGTNEIQIVISWLGRVIYFYIIQSFFTKISIVLGISKIPRCLSNINNCLTFRGQCCQIIQVRRFGFMCPSLC